jgi:hypothetical protein
VGSAFARGHSCSSSGVCCHRQPKSKGARHIPRCWRGCVDFPLLFGEGVAWRTRHTPLNRLICAGRLRVIHHIHQRVAASLEHHCDMPLLSPLLMADGGSAGRRARQRSGLPVPASALAGRSVGQEGRWEGQSCSRRCPGRVIVLTTAAVISRIGLGRE